MIASVISPQFLIACKIAILKIYVKLAPLAMVIRPSQGTGV